MEKKTYKGHYHKIYNPQISLIPNFFGYTSYYLGISLQKLEVNIILGLGLNGTPSYGNNVSKYLNLSFKNFRFKLI